MSFLHSLISLPREGLIITAAVVMGLLAVVWLVTLFASRQRYVTIRRSDETELLAFHLRRIADALEQLATARETQPSADTSPGKPIGMSMFGR